MNTVTGLWPFLAVLMLALTGQAVVAADFDSERRRAFELKMANEHDFEPGQLSRLLDSAQLQQSILDAISRPAEGKAWHAYRKIFLTEKRVAGGAQFWQQHADLLRRAQQHYGVDAAVIVAIIGVETFYGRHAGNYRVIDALTTLGFNYPKRADFFARELEQFLLMCRQQGLDPLTLKGSYAGAMGMPQFISSSYRSYAVDFDADGRVDIWNTPADAIGSVANYLSRHGWKADQHVTEMVDVAAVTDKVQAMLDQGYKPALTEAELVAGGVEVPPYMLKGGARASLMAFAQPDTTDYWLGLDNFYVITRYNHSPLYAMAVYQLAGEIVQRRLQRGEPIE